MIEEKRVAGAKGEIRGRNCLPRVPAAPDAESRLERGGGGVNRRVKKSRSRRARSSLMPRHSAEHGSAQEVIHRLREGAELLRERVQQRGLGVARKRGEDVGDVEDPRLDSIRCLNRARCWDCASNAAFFAARSAATSGRTARRYTTLDFVVGTRRVMHLATRPPEVSSRQSTN